MKAYKVELLIVNHDNLGSDEIKEVIENQHYPNHCIAPNVMNIVEKEIGEWNDDHPLNYVGSVFDEYQRLFSLPSTGEDDMTAKEFFDSPESPITLDNICTPVEKEFLLDTIEMFAKGKVNQALKAHPPASVEPDKNFLVRLKANIDKRMMAAGIFTKWLASYDDYDDFTKAKTAFFDSFNDLTISDLYKTPLPPASVGMEEAVKHIRGMMLYMTQGWPKNESERIDNARCAGFNQAIAKVLEYLPTASTPPAKDTGK